MCPIPTRTIDECQRLVSLWEQGRRKEVIKELGYEPSEDFLKTFHTQKAKKPPLNQPKQGRKPE